MPSGITAISVSAFEVPHASAAVSTSVDTEKAAPIVYSHGTYFGLGESLGTFGYSVRKKKKKEKK